MSNQGPGWEIFSRARHQEAEMPSETVTEQRGLWFDELEVGALYRHSPGRTVSEADNTLFSTLTMNLQAMHLDAEFAAESEFGQRLVNSLLTLSVLIGLSANHLTQKTLVANLGFEEVSFPAPVFGGDTIFGETRVTAVRDSASRPRQGIVTFEHIARNQHHDIVAKVTRTSLIWKSGRS